MKYDSSFAARVSIIHIFGEPCEVRVIKTGKVTFTPIGEYKRQYVNARSGRTPQAAFSSWKQTAEMMADH